MSPTWAQIGCYPLPCKQSKHDLDTEKKEAEINTIKQIIRNNGYDASATEKVNYTEFRQEKKTHDNKKWTKFTYVGRETRQITKFFRNTQVEVFYTTNNRLDKLLQSNTSGTKNKYDRSGIYQLKCPSCDKKYVGQTGRPFHVRFREHQHDFRYMCRKSKFAQHLLDEGHDFSPMEDIMDVIQYANRGKLMDTIERFHIYELTSKGSQINDKLTIQRNPIFETVVWHLQHKGNH